MDTNLTNYLEFLENSSKFKAMDKAAKAQMLSQINELIKSEALWVRNARFASMGAVASIFAG